MASNQIVPFKEKVATVLDLLKKKSKQLEAALPKHITVERMLAVALRSIQNNPKLVECDQRSLMSAIMQSAQLGLECDGVTQEAYLVPFKVKGVMKVQLIIGYPGLLKLVRNTGELASIQTQAVHEKDLFEYQYGLDPKLMHVPSRDDEPGHIWAFWCAAKLRDGSPQFEVMLTRDVNKIRDRSSGYRAAKQFNFTTPWETDYEEMGRKTALRRVCKMLPKSTERYARAMQLVEQEEAGIEQEFDVDLIPEESSSSLDAMVDQAETQKQAASQPQQPPQPQTDHPKGGGRAAGAKPPAPNKPLDRPGWAEGSDPDPELSGNLFGGREPGIEG